MPNTDYIYNFITRLLAGILLLGIVAGCGGTVKNTWSNFRAYYNTYYNAEKNFRAGLAKVEQQPFEIDPREPVRIHPPSVQAGNSDFQKAIDKGAQILRKFPDSKWMDDALLLIGKSYYYRQEFYPAIQKFEELRNATDVPEMKQRAIIWKGRTLLDLKQYSKGVSFLEPELEAYPQDWSVVNRGEIQALLAEHHAMIENWEQAQEALSQAVANIEKKELLGRTFFLHGQVLERIDRFGAAYYAYSQVSEYFPGFEYTYWAGMKQADVARKQGSMDQAIAIYDRLRRDDKNIDRTDRLQFEIARTLEMKGEIDDAEHRYKELLYQDQGPGSRSLKGDIYFRLGKIYSESYNNFNVAAAYFDSSSSAGRQQPSSDGNMDAQTLAESFGEYTELRDEVSRADSLLWLGSLPAQKLDSVLAEIRRKKRQELLAEQESESQSRLVNRNLDTGDGQATRSSIYGFLNHRNQELVQRGKTEFKLTWGDRPLADNWRRIEAVRQFSAENDQQASQQTDTKVGRNGQSDAQLDLDVSAIPRTQKAKTQLQAEKANAQYELGNLFFLNLNLPDSAIVYFRNVVESEAGSELRPRAMYSLHELYKVEQQSDSLKYWRKRILEEYPHSRYAKMIRSGGNVSSADLIADSSNVKLRQKYRRIDSLQNPQKPTKLRRLALANRSSEMAPYIYYQAIESYIHQARYSDTLLSKKRNLPAGDTTDTAPIIVTDSTAADKAEKRQYNTVYWDSVRMALQEFDTTFTDAKQRPRVMKLKTFLEQQQQESSIKTCEQLGISLSVAPSMEDFLATISYPDKLKNSSLSGKLEYSFVVTGDGTIESYRLESNRTSLGIEDAFEEAFDQQLQFKPVEGDDIPQKMRCTVRFPIKQ